MIELASFDKCTACGACAYVCPKSCIKMTKIHMVLYILSLMKMFV